MDLFALGTPVIDLFARVDEASVRKLGIEKGATTFFDEGGLARIERSLGKKITYRYPGDNARNVCEGFAALGGFCGFQGAVGDDEEGAYFAAHLQQSGISAFLQEKKGRTGRILCLVTPDAERTFCADLGVSEEADRWEKLAVSESKMFYVASITLCRKGKVASLAMRYLEACKKMGKRIALSLENPPQVEANRKMLLSVAKNYADVLFLNESEAEALLGESFGKKLLSLKPHIPVYLKKGRLGSALFLGGKTHAVPPMDAKVVDTTGAGDAYAAGALYGLSRGYSALGSGRIGCMLATAVVKKRGAGIPLAHTRIRMATLHKKAP
jgi:sugar/nucleoside kinase (ribokinase family)